MISFFLSFAAANNIIEYQQKLPTLPAFCNGIECPQYKSVKNYTVSLTLDSLELSKFNAAAGDEILYSLTLYSIIPTLG